MDLPSWLFFSKNLSDDLLFAPKVQIWEKHLTEHFVRFNKKNVILLYPFMHKI